MQFEIHKEMQAPAAEVFQLITSDDKLKLWMTNHISNTYPKGMRPALIGTKFIQKVKEGGRKMVYNGEIIAWEPNRHFAVKMGNHAFTAEMHYRLQPKGDNATALSYSANVTYSGWFYKMLGKWFFKYMVKLWEEQLERLKQAAGK